MKNPHLIPIWAIIFVVFLPEATHQASFIRFRRATPEIFDNGHIIPHATFQRLMLSRQDGRLDRFTNLQNFLQGIHATDADIRADAGMNRNRNPYPSRRIQTLVVGTDQEVHDALLPQNAVQVSPLRGSATNLWETTATFPVLNIYRDENGNFERLTWVQRPIAAAVENGRPVHFQAQYVRPDGTQPDYTRAEVTVYEAQQGNDGQGAGDPNGSGGPGGGDGSGSGDGSGGLGSGNPDGSNSGGGHGGSGSSVGLGSGNLQMGLSPFGQGSGGNSLNADMSSFGGGPSGYNGNGGWGMGSYGTNGVNLAVPLASLNSFHVANIPASSSNVSPWLPLIVPKGFTGFPINGK